MSATNLSPSTSLLRRRDIQLLLAALLLLIGAFAFRGMQLMQRLANPEPIAFAPIQQTAADQVTRLEERIAHFPNDTDAYAQLGFALLQQVRATGDSAGYAAAESALNEALERDPEHVDALLGLGVLGLAEHHFEEALAVGEKARAINPFRAEILGVIVDSQVELGFYDKALASAQEMVSLRPSLESYTRVSYLRELHGDMAGAVVAMQAATDAGVPGTESALWTGYQLGDLYFKQGDLKQADRVFDSLLAQQPTYAYGQAGKAQVLAARGKEQAAIDIYERVVEQMPLPGFLIALGDLYMATGETAKADALFAEVRAGQVDDIAAGMNEQLEIAMFEIGHSTDHAQNLALTQHAYEMRPNIFAEDTLAWALYKTGDAESAWPYTQRALRLGTQDPHFYYHAGVIAHELGKEAEAVEYLEQAIAINPYFSAEHVAEAKATLTTLK